MSTPYDDFVTWFNETPGAADYTRARGTWVDSPTHDLKRFAVFQFMGGPKPDVEHFSASIDVLLLGKKGERNVAGALPDIENFAYDLIRRSLTNSCSGSITSIRSQAMPVGPGFTTEDRPWYRLSFLLMGCE